MPMADHPSLQRHQVIDDPLPGEPSFDGLTARFDESRRNGPVVQQFATRRRRMHSARRR